MKLSREAHDRAAANLLMALDMFETGLALKRAQFRRAAPGASDAEIEDQIQAWLIRSSVDAD